MSNRHTYVIAEAGSCHDGSLTIAKDMVKLAARAGADAVKFQYWSSPTRLSERRHLVELGSAYKDAYRYYQLSAAWLPELAEMASQVGLDFMCSTYLPEDIAVVAPYVEYFKVASFEAGDKDFLQAHFKFAQPMIVSTGLCTQRDLDRLRGRVRATDKILHCISGYPTPIHELNLRMISSAGLDGFSDHSGKPEVGFCAVLAGARFLEVHFRHNWTELENPDAGKHSLHQGDLEKYITGVRAAEVLLGSPERVVQPSEQRNLAYRVIV